MNATGHVQSKWYPKGVILTLHGTRCVHTSMNLRKIKFISYIYTLFLHRFFFIICEIFISILQISVEEKLYSDVFGYYSRHHDITSTERYIGQSTFAFIYDVA